MHPYLLHFGHLTIPTFGLLAALGIMAALALSLRSARLAGLSPDVLWNAGIFAVFAAFFLSRLLLVVTNLHTFFSYPVLLLAVPSLTPLGLLLTAVAVFVYLRLRRLPLLPTLDAWAPAATLLWSALALGHFAEASDPGLPSHLPWALAFPGDPTRLHPVALYAAVFAAALTAALLRQLSRADHHPGRPAALALGISGLAQFLLTFLRRPYTYMPPFTSPLDPMEWLALGMIVAASLLFLQTPSRRSVPASATDTSSPHTRVHAL